MIYFVNDMVQQKEYFNCKIINVSLHIVSNMKFVLYSTLIACLHEQNKSVFFGGPAFISPIRAI